MQAVPALGARLGRSGDRWRGFGACRRGEGEAVAAVVANGGDEPVRVGERERSRGGNEHMGERRGRGERVVSPGTSREKRQAGGGRGAWARTAATRLSSYWREVGDDWQWRWDGPARWAGQLGYDR